jgi:protein-S-isoprenylcysteine O-methyltransferase Ste14
MISFWGWALLTGAAGVFVLAIAAVMMYSIVAPLEERELREYHGEEYAEYQRAVPRFIPRLRRTARLRGT